LTKIEVFLEWCATAQHVMVASWKASTFITASWWHSSQVTDSERTPFSRMLASVIGGPE
jgi:hypothetical protein